MLKLPTISGIIRRRLLVNFRVDPERVQAMLPKGFRPKLHQGHAIAGICLIRLENIRPRGFPAFIGLSSENAAHRIAVEWEESDGLREGVFIPRRDTNSCFNALTGGRLFPGYHHHARFQTEDRDGKIKLTVTPRDTGRTLIDVEAEESDHLPGESVFSTLTESSLFFERGCTGYSPCPGSQRLDGLRLVTGQWKVTPLAVHSVYSAFFADRETFPEGSAVFDHALLMRDIPHQWVNEVPPRLAA